MRPARHWLKVRGCGEIGRIVLLVAGEKRAYAQVILSPLLSQISLSRDICQEASPGYPVIYHQMTGCDC